MCEKLFLLLESVRGFPPGPLIYGPSTFVPQYTQPYLTFPYLSRFQDAYSLRPSQG